MRSLPSVDVVGGCDALPEQRTNWTQETGTPAFGSLEELADRTSPDAVVIATPPDSHAALCIQALELGLHVFCEKPFAVSVAEADEVLAVAHRARRRVAVNHEFRAKPMFRAIRERIVEEEYGRLVFCQMWQLMDLPPWGEPAPWRAAMADRALLEGGVHVVDLMLMLYGCSPEAVYARHSSGLERERPADAVHLLTLEFPGGRLGQITIDRLCRAGTRYLDVRADCEHGTLRASLGGRAFLQIGMKRAERTGIRLELASGGMAWAERGFARRKLAGNPRRAAAHATSKLLAEIVSAFEQGREPPSSGRDARLGLGVIEAAYESGRSGRRIELSTIWERAAAARSVGERSVARA